MEGGGFFNFMAGVTTLFVIAVVLNNSLGVRQMLTGLGNLYGAAVGQKPLPIPTR